ncbi:hypothetical protein OROMI_017921 [Orobanche minor]
MDQNCSNQSDFSEGTPMQKQSYTSSNGVFVDNIQDNFLATQARKMRKILMTDRQQIHTDPLLNKQTHLPLSDFTNVYQKFESGTFETIDVISEAVSSSNIPRTSILCTENGMKSPVSQQIQSLISSLVNVAAPTSISSRKMRK